MERSLKGSDEADIVMEIVGQSDIQINGITKTKDGRLLAPVQGPPDPGVPKLGQLHADRSLTPYPDAPWNGWTPGDKTANAFVGVVSVRMGPDGLVWVVDKGSPGFIAKVVTGGPKLVCIDAETNTVVRSYPLDDATKGWSLLDDVRFNGRMAYITDAYCPGIVVLDLDTGEARRVLDGDPSTTGKDPLRADGKELSTPDGKSLITHVDQLEVSPDGSLLYFQPTPGPMSVIETRYLDDPSLDPQQLSGHVRLFAPTKSTGGTAMDAFGNIYVSHTDECAIMKITPDGTMTELLRDDRLQWVDAMWIDDNGDLLAPASQLNLGAPLNKGVDEQQPPFNVYAIKLGLAPLRR